MPLHYAIADTLSLSSLVTATMVGHFLQVFTFARHLDGRNKKRIFDDGYF